ncbi:PID-CTERM protein-sorting domain-containing protein [Longibacter sp.]|uniref:PID-CTERM protein-sorting domain-containing protein n=1 Tax=Longibacter sp. TaxID=2045415 RepID=UPI003EBF7D59
MNHRCALTFTPNARIMSPEYPAFRHMSTTMADIRYDRFFWTVSAALLLILLVAQPVQAQQDRQDPYSPRETQTERGSSVGLPSWAEPGNSKQAITPPPNTPDDPPDLPGDPPQIPVDGGLGFLALAGAGYAVSRLRKRGDDSDDPVA